MWQAEHSCWYFGSSGASVVRPPSAWASGAIRASDAANTAPRTNGMNISTPLKSMGRAAESRLEGHQPGDHVGLLCRRALSADHVTAVPAKPLLGLFGIAEALGVERRSERADGLAGGGMSAGLGRHLAVATRATPRTTVIAGEELLPTGRAW